MFPNPSQAEASNFLYSEIYHDDVYEYRHVILPPHIADLVPRNHLMTQTEWRNLGVRQSQNWIHYMVHVPEPHILLYRRQRQAETQDNNQI